MSDATSKRTILVVEDDPDLQRLVSIMLKRGNFNVFVGGTAAKGMQLFEEAKPDLVILDIGLPDRPGLDVCKELRGKHKHLPILMLTARYDKTAYQDAMRLGASDFLCKPVRQPKLIEMVEQLLAAVPPKKKFGVF